MEPTRNPSYPAEWPETLHLHGPERDALIAAMAQPAPVSIRLHPMAEALPLGLRPVPWCPGGYYLQERPHFAADPAWHAGAYYVQEASSMFLHHVVTALHLDRTPIAALDLCAAPGGKSTLLRSVLHADALLLCNEVVGSRANLLEENLLRWGLAGYAVSQSDPSRFASLPPLFDLVVVDAPCSGEGLFRKDPAAAAEWSPHAVQQCAVRQQHILSQVWPALKPGGYLVYSTCTFNRLENEAQALWLREAVGAASVAIGLPHGGIAEVQERGITAYRFYPHRVEGEGFFTAIFRKEAGRYRPPTLRNSLKLQPFAGAPPLQLALTPAEDAFAVRSAHTPMLSFLAAKIRLRQPGVPVGKWQRGALKPAQGFAMLRSAANPYPTRPLTLAEARTFLRREDLPHSDLQSPWVVCTFDGFALGLAKASTARLQSQYPVEWRLRSREDLPHTSLAKPKAMKP